MMFIAFFFIKKSTQVFSLPFRLEEAREDTRQVERELEEFQENSQQLEKELETQLEQADKTIRELRTRNNRLQLDSDTLKVDYVIVTRLL